MKEEIKQQLKGKRILFATFPFDGHFNPLTGFAHFLSSSGSDVRWYTGSIFAEKLKKLNLTHYPFKKALDVNAINVDELFPERKLIIDLGEKANYDMEKVFCAMSKESFEDIQEIYQTFPFDIVVADGANPVIPFIYPKLGVPVLSIGIMPLPEESVDLGPYGPGFYPPPNEQQREEFDALKEVFTKKIFKGAIDKYSGILDEYNIESHREPLFSTLVRYPDLYLQIGSPSFEYKRSNLGSNIRFIGSLLPYSNKKQQHTWFDKRLDQYAKIVLVTQGTVEQDFTKLLEPTIEAF